ncbi:hypothetical protein EW026_g181 [Hermanssonia centrifuga]|nr:hypothetical protein EW026_g181 [Hermanssonia centrifuga]
MDKFVTVIKPSAKSLNGGKQDTKKQRSELRYKPYGDNKASEQLAEDLTEKERVKR